MCHFVLVFSCLHTGESRSLRRYVFRLSLCPILMSKISQERLEVISSNVHLESRMKWIDLGGQRSKVKIIVASHSCECNISRIPRVNVHLDLNLISFWSITRSKNCDCDVISQEWLEGIPQNMEQFITTLPSDILKITWVDFFEELPSKNVSYSV